MSVLARCLSRKLILEMFDFAIELLFKMVLSVLVLPALILIAKVLDSPLERFFNVSCHVLGAAALTLAMTEFRDMIVPVLALTVVIGVACSTAAGDGGHTVAYFFGAEPQQVTRPE